MKIRRTVALFLACAAVANGELPSERVLERYQQMLETNPVDGTAVERLWKAYADAGNGEQLIQQYERGSTFASQMVLGHLLRRAGEQEKARSAYDRAAALRPDDPLPFRSIASLLKEMNKPVECAGAWEKTAVLTPRDSPERGDVLLELGAAWMWAGDATKASEAWEQTIALSPSNLDLRRRLAETYLDNGLSERAIPQLEYLAAHAPPAERVDAFQNLARMCEIRGDFPGAIGALRQCVNLTQPGHWLRKDLQGQLIRLYQRAHRLPELEKEWQEHARANPRDIGGYLQLIQLYERLSSLKQQREWLEKLVQLAPKTPEYRQRLAALLVQLDEFQRAAALLDQLIAEQPGNSDLVFERAQIDLMADAPAAARDRIDALLQRRSGDEAIGAKAIQFFQQNRLWTALEEHLKASAASGNADAIVALAEFLFAQARDAEGREQLGRLVRPDSSPRDQAAAWVRIAQFLKAQNQIAAAIDALERALSLTTKTAPERREWLLQLAELRIATGDPLRASIAYREAADLSRTPMEQKETDQRLFDSLRQQGTEQPELTQNGRGIILPPPAGELPFASKPLTEYIDQVRAKADSSNTAGDWLRLAQWLAWQRNFRGALDAANKAVEADPESPVAQEFAVNLISPDVTATAFHFRRLAEAFPAERTQYLRRAAQLELQGGKVEQAIQLLSDLASQLPTNLDILADLANGQRRAMRWEDAAATWEKFLASSPGSRRSEAAEPLTAIYERLGQPEKGARLLLSEVERRTDAKEKSEAFSKVLAFCAEHELVQWLRAEWEKCRARVQDDDFTQLALARIVKAQGQRAEALQLLADVSVSARDLSTALPELVREAEELHDLGAAIGLQSRLVSLAGGGRLDEWLRLAELQERNMDFPAAGKTWSRITARFSRDTTALMAAAEFWLREDDLVQAIRLLQRLRSLGPASAPVISLLADLELEHGNPAEAAKCLEELLKVIPATAEEGVRFPDVPPGEESRLQSAYLAVVRSRGSEPTAGTMRDVRKFWAPPSRAGATQQDQRLEAIRRLAKIIPTSGSPGEQTSWVNRWKTQPAMQPSEALWALYYGGAASAALDIAEGLMRRDPQNMELKQGFIWLGLQAHEARRIGAWCSSRECGPNERDFLAIALGRYVETGGSLDHGFLEQLFESAHAARLWQAASLLAGSSRFSEAVMLGQRAFALGGEQKSTMGLKLADWCQSNWWSPTGDTSEAIEILRSVSAGPGDSFDDPCYEAMRTLYPMLPSEEKAAWMERSVERLSEAPPVHAAIAGALLHGLGGNEFAAKQHLQRLVDMQAYARDRDELKEPAASRWTFLLSAGVHLQEWKLDRLAQFVWERTLADPALIKLHGEQAQEAAREMRTRLAAIRLSQLPVREIPAALPDVLRRLGKDEGIAFGQAVEALEAYPHAVAIYRILWDNDRANIQPLRCLLNACRQAKDEETAEAALRSCLEERLFPNDSIQRELTKQLADMLEQREDLSGTIKVLEVALNTWPLDLRLHQRLATLLENAGRFADAEVAWKELVGFDLGNTVARSALAALQEKDGRFAEAATTLTRPETMEADPRLPVVLARQGKYEDALAVLQRVSGQELATAAISVAQELVARGERKLARFGLQGAIGRVTDSLTVLRLRTAVVETLEPKSEKDAVLRELRHLRRLARRTHEETDYFTGWLKAKAARLEIEELTAGAAPSQPSGTVSRSCQP